jgi:protein-disulfide isomerase
VTARFGFGVLALFLAAGALGQSSKPTAPAKQAPAPGAVPAAVLKQIEAYMRHLYAWGPDFQLKFSAFGPSPVAGLDQVTVEVSKDQERDSGVVYVSHDGQYILRGEINDLRKDPLADILALLHLEDSPSTGPADAPVTVVEFADFECPACGQLHGPLRSLLQQYPQVRLVYKDFPIPQLHPWAQTAALAGRCVYLQNHEAFWKFYDAMYDNQALISPQNAWDKILEYAAAAGVNPDQVKTCSSTPDAVQAVNAASAQGKDLGITSTPTLFVNGRRILGANIAFTKQCILYDLQTSPKLSKAPTQ